MNGGKAAGGYTIIESVIFLAVTGMLFTVAFIFIAGKQAKTEFQQSSRDFLTALEDVINDTSAGFYPGGGNFVCSPTTNGPTYATGAVEQGANIGCIFAGKVIQFNSGVSSFNVFSMGGLKQAGIPPEDVTDLGVARVRAIAPPFASGGVDLTSTVNMTYGLRVTKAYYQATTGGAVTTIGGVGFFSTFSYSGGSPITGTSLVDVEPAVGSNLSETRAAFLSHVNTDSLGLTHVPNATNPARVVVCTSSPSGKKAAYVIGDKGRRTAVQLFIDDMNKVLDPAGTNPTERCP